MSDNKEKFVVGMNNSKELERSDSKEKIVSG